jgi:diguanylate cyclase (GGDEF)-like protein/PAS domain S-box-containing protein
MSHDEHEPATEPYGAVPLGVRAGSWTWDITSGETVFDERWAKMLGYRLDELTPTTIETWQRLNDDEDPLGTDAFIEEHRRGRHPHYEVDVRMTHRDGHWVWVHRHGHVVAWADDGRPLRMAGTHEDITDEVLARQALAESESRFSKMFDRHEAVMLLVEPATGSIVDANPAAAAFYGYPVDTLRSMTIAEINMLPPEEVARRRTQAFQMHRNHFVFPHRLASGETRTVEVHSSPFEDGGRSLLFSIIRDVTDQEVYENQLRRAAAVFENTLEAVVITDADRIIVQVNPAFTDFTGWRPEETIGHSIAMIREMATDAHSIDSIRMHVDAGNGSRGEFTVMHADGTGSPILLSVSPIPGPMGEITGYVAVMTDIGTMKAAQAELEYLAHHDTVTGLPNRVHFAERVGDHLALKRGAGVPSALLLIDLDRFTGVLASYGRPAGDEVLSIIGSRLADLLGPRDILAKMSGDQFAVLLAEVEDVDAARRFAALLLEAISPACLLSTGVEVFTSACVGLILLPGISDEVESALQRADAALSQAKLDGPGSIRHHTDALVQDAQARLSLATRLRHAWADGELALRYQPQMDAATGVIAGAEALLRWVPPTGEEVAPSVFIPMAEEIGLIGHLGRWALREACRQGQAWIAAGQAPLTMSVNVSARQLERGDLPEDVARILADTGFPGDLLELELTESALLEAGQVNADQLRRLTRQGVRLSIDDFGTGYSSFAYLKTLPLDELKIDRSFVRDLENDPGDRAITAAIVAMGHHLGLRVLAEGVETPGQLELLRGQGCDSFQGFLVSPALDPDDFAALVVGRASPSGHHDPVPLMDRPGMG